MVELKEPANLNEFKELLSKNSKVIVDFTASWCGPCRLVKPVIHKLAEKYTDILFLVVDVDERADIASEYGIRAMPTVMFFKDGAKADEMVGAAPITGYEQKIAEVL
ncbi:Putative Thioredoxin [Rhizopus microsporus]|nr:Putative Thioredoxin [Rhizopus microsporus]